MTSTTHPALAALRPFLSRKTGNENQVCVPLHVLEEAAAALGMLSAEMGQGLAVQGTRTTHLANAEQLIAWLRSEKRAPAARAFRAGPERDIADAVEVAVDGQASAEAGIGGPVPRILMDLPVAHAMAVHGALDFYARVQRGRFEAVAAEVSNGNIPMFGTPDATRRAAAESTAEEIMRLMKMVKSFLGYPPDSNLGVGHPHINVAGRRAYETQKVLARALGLNEAPMADAKAVELFGG